MVTKKQRETFREWIEPVGLVVYVSVVFCPGSGDVKCQISIDKTTTGLSFSESLSWHFCVEISCDSLVNKHTDNDMSVYLYMNKLKLADNLGCACVLVEL